MIHSNLRFLVKLLIIMCFLVEGIVAASTVITFEGLSHGGNYWTDPNIYNNIGINFENATAVDFSPDSVYRIDDFTHSGDMAIRACFGVEFCTAPIRIVFDPNVHRVKIWAGYAVISSINNPFEVILSAYDLNGSLITQDKRMLRKIQSPEEWHSSMPIQTPLEVYTKSDSIRSVTISCGLEDLGGLAIDDVEFSTNSSTKQWPVEKGLIAIVNGKKIWFGSISEMPIMPVPPPRPI